MKARILLLPGDGVGPEVIAQGRRALESVARMFGHDFALVEGLVGFMAMDATGQALPADTVAACRICDAVLVGAVSGPADGEPQSGLRRLCRANELHSNLMPVRIHPALRRLAPIRPDLLTGVDLLLVRDRAGVGGWGGQATVVAGAAPDDQLPSVIRVALRAAARRRGRLSLLGPAREWMADEHWRSQVASVAEGYPAVSLEHLDLATCEQRLDDRPAGLDVILACGPGFDGLHRRLATMAGSPGLLPSATLGDGTFGIYEPAHGAAAGTAGSRSANPTAALLSASLLLRHSFELVTEAQALEQAVHDALAAGRHTADVAGDPSRSVTTSAFTDAVLDRLGECAARAGGQA